MAFESYTDLARKFGRGSSQRRFPELYRQQQQQQAAGLEAAQSAANAPYGSLEAQNNPFAFGTVFRRQNQGLAGQYDAELEAEQAKQQDAMLRQQQADEDRQLRRRESLMREAYNGRSF